LTQVNISPSAVVPNLSYGGFLSIPWSHVKLAIVLIIPAMLAAQDVPGADKDAILLQAAVKNEACVYVVEGKTPFTVTYVNKDNVTVSRTIKSGRFWYAFTPEPGQKLKVSATRLQYQVGDAGYLDATLYVGGFLAGEENKERLEVKSVVLEGNW
jgi:hypothetical protein